MKDFKCMLGAACGDIAGSVYEHHNIKYEISEEKLITEICRFTDDTVMTCAVAEGICNALSMLLKDWMRFGRIIVLMYPVMDLYLRR